MKEIKITTKLVISIIMIDLMCMFCFELAYNKIVYKDYAEVYEELQTMESRVDKLIEINMQLQKYILEKTR